MKAAIAFCEDEKAAIILEGEIILEGAIILEKKIWGGDRFVVGVRLEKAIICWGSRGKTNQNKYPDDDQLDESW